MKIIYASDAGLPGRAANAVHVMKMSQAFSNNGNKVILIARKNEQYYHGLKNIYKDYAVRPVFGIHMSPYPDCKGKGIIYTADALRFIRKRRPDLVYGRSMYICSLTALLLRKPVVFEIHGETKRTAKMGILFALLIRSRYLKRLVVISESLSGYYQKQWKIPKEKILTAHDGADLQMKGYGYEKIHIPEDGKNIGYFGSLYKGKGMELIVRIAAKMPDYRFHIFGGREEETAHWKKETAHLANIIYHGYISQGGVSAYGRKMDVLLAPYQPHVYTSVWKKTEDIGKYMSPMKLFEYMSFKRPIVCTDLPVIREVLENGKEALLCDARDIRAWTDAIETLCADKEFSSRISENAGKKLEQKYTWEKRACRVLESL